MNRYKKLGLVIAILLLIAAIAVKYLFGDETSATISLPILCFGLAALMVCDTIAYKHPDPSTPKLTHRLELARLVAGWLVTGLVLTGTIIYISFK